MSIMVAHPPIKAGSGGGLELVYTSPNTSSFTINPQVTVSSGYWFRVYVEPFELYSDGDLVVMIPQLIDDSVKTERNNVAYGSRVSGTNSSATTLSIPEEFAPYEYAGSVIGMGQRYNSTSSALYQYLSLNYKGIFSLSNISSTSGVFASTPTPFPVSYPSLKWYISRHSSGPT